MPKVTLNTIPGPSGDIVEIVARRTDGRKEVRHIELADFGKLIATHKSPDDLAKEEGGKA